MTHCCRECDWVDEEHIRQVEMAYAEMQRRGWGFTSNGHGFGDPHASFTAVGPYDGTTVQVLAMDPSPVSAVYKAIEMYERKQAS